MHQLYTMEPGFLLEYGFQVLLVGQILKEQLNHGISLINQGISSNQNSGPFIGLVTEQLYVDVIGSNSLGGVFGLN